MPIGTCRLCQLQNVELRDSQFHIGGLLQDRARREPVEPKPRTNEALPQTVEHVVS